MEILNELRLKCDEILKTSNDEKYIYIKKILENDNCFFIMNMEIAIDILESLGINNPLDYYSQLISYDNIEKNYVKIID